MLLNFVPITLSCKSSSILLLMAKQDRWVVGIWYKEEWWRRRQEEADSAKAIADY